MGWRAAGGATAERKKDEGREKVGRRRRLMLLSFLGILVLGVIWTADAAPQVAAKTLQDAPPGCPGGRPGTPAPGTRCPDGSLAGKPPRGCPGGPPGIAYPGTVCPDGS